MAWISFLNIVPDPTEFDGDVERVNGGKRPKITGNVTRGNPSESANDSNIWTRSIGKKEVWYVYNTRAHNSKNSSKHVDLRSRAIPDRPPPPNSAYREYVYTLLILSMLDDGRRSAVTWAMTLLNDGRRSLSVMDVGHKWSMPQDVRRLPEMPPPPPPKLVPPPRDVDGVIRKSRLAAADDCPPNSGASHKHGAGGVAETDDRFSATVTPPPAGDGNRLQDRRSLTAAAISEP